MPIDKRKKDLYGRDRRFTFDISDECWHKLMKIADKMHCSNAQAARLSIEMAFEEVCKGRYVHGETEKREIQD